MPLPQPPAADWHPQSHNLCDALRGYHLDAQLPTPSGRAKKKRRVPPSMRPGRRERSRLRFLLVLSKEVQIQQLQNFGGTLFVVHTVLKIIYDSFRLFSTV